MEDLDKIEARYPDNDPIDNDVRALIAELRQTRLQNGEAQKLLGRAKAMIYEAFAEALIVGGGHDVLVQGKEGELLTEIDTYLKGVEKPKCVKCGWEVPNIPGRTLCNGCHDAEAVAVKRVEGAPKCYCPCHEDVVVPQGVPHECCSTPHAFLSY